MSLHFDEAHRAVIVGAGGAIGSAIASAYADAGAQVVALDLEPEPAQRAVQGLPGGPHSSAVVDVTDRDAVARMAADLGAVDSLVYAAGIAPTFDILDFDWDTYHRTLAVNLHGALHVAQAFGRAMAEAAGGSMVFLSSAAGKRGEAGAAAYCASKFAILGIVECFAAEVGRFGVRVNAICPGNVDTPMLRSVAAAQAAREDADPAAVLQSYAEEAAARRLVSTAEVAATAVWLASPLASGISGESVNVDAGALTG